MNAALRVGFLGAGLIATFHSKMLRHSGADATWAGVHDPDGQRRESFARASGARACETEEELLERCDAVYVCTPTSEHPRLVAAAVERGLAVFCEKPLGVDVETARSMTESVSRAGVTNQVGLILRSSPAVALVRSLLDDDSAGRPMSVVFRDDQFIPIQGHYASTWRGDVRQAGSGTLLEHSIHDVDLLEHLFGPIESVSTRSEERHGIVGIEDNVASSMRFRDGTLAVHTSVWHDILNRGSLRRLEIICERMQIVLEGDDWFGPVQVTGAASDAVPARYEGDALVAELERRAVGISNPDGRFAEAAARHEPSWPDFEVALRAHVVVDAMYRSAAAGGAAVSVPDGTTDGGFEDAADRAGIRLR